MRRRHWTVRWAASLNANVTNPNRAQREIGTMLETAMCQKDGVVLLSIQELRLMVIGITLVVLCILLLLC